MEIAGKPEVIDIFFLITCLRITYISARNGLLKESFKIVGVVAGIFLSFYYFVPAGSWLNQKVFFLQKDFSEFLSFLLIFSASILLLSFLRIAVGLFFKRENFSRRERLVSVVIGGVRAVFFSSIVLFMLILSPLPRRYFEKSFSWEVFRLPAPAMYIFVFETFKKSVPQERTEIKIENYYKTDWIGSRQR
ncbi:MAG: hypothetical protein GF375_07605 [Candidatus Omnitrophica bacterium]|nr:hypothetical protein [Candidatus Omnitrophota bacterium]MBD3269836.1 hypothetical protein [Candidatus Omnitrophota bacterium]